MDTIPAARPAAAAPAILKVHPAAPDAAVVRTAAELLAAGRIVAYPTDTLYGLAVDPRLPDAVQRLLRAKGRPAHMAIPLIAADTGQVARIAAALTPLARRLAAAFWPGPLTLVLDAAADLNRRLLAGGSTVAVRVPDQPLARELARVCGHPLTATSANRSGSPPALTAAEAAAALDPELACVLDGGAAGSRSPSTIVDARGAAPILLRAGATDWDRVLAAGGAIPGRTESGAAAG